MKRFVSLSLALAFILCLTIASERQALAYVDPGSGLLALQGFASVAAGFLYYMRRRILALFGRKKEAVQPALQSARPQPTKAA